MIGSSPSAARDSNLSGSSGHLPLMTTRARAERAACWLWLAALLGCSSLDAEPLADAVNPVGVQDAQVVRMDRTGPYLLAELKGPRLELRFLAPTSEVCLAVLRVEAAVRYAKQGVFGAALRDGSRCEFVGVASLAAWRDRRSRVPGKPFPRATARFEILERGGGMALVRGRFPFTDRIGIGSGFDLVALVPDDAACRRPLERGEAAVEFRDNGPTPFRLASDDGVCAIAGFALPPAAR